VTDPAPPGREAQPSRTAWRTSAVAAVVLAAVVAGAVWWHGASPGPAEPTTSATTPAAGLGSGEGERDARAAALVAALDAALDGRSRARLLAVAGTTDRARAWAGEIHRNLDLLHARDVALRYVAERRGTLVSRSGQAASFIGDVEVRWTPGRRSGYAPRLTSPVTVPMRFVDDGRRVTITGLAPVGDDALPVWLAGPLNVSAVPGAVCVGVGHGDVPAVRTLVRTAVREVRDVIPPTQPVAVVVPSDAQQAGSMLGSSASDLSQIAAVTSTVDGSSDARAPVQVVLNPAVFDALGPRGAQVVITHEVTHAVTGATEAPMPLWVAEGFADFVALHDGRIPLRVAAQQILSEVERHGPPAKLPSRSDFSASAAALGTTYEAAWLVFRLLADRHGDVAIVSFYQRVLDGAPVAKALRAEFGIGVPALTRAWGDYLDRLAHA